MSRVMYVKLINLIACLAALMSTDYAFGEISSYSRNDPYPVFSSLDPHMFLQMQERLYLKGLPTTKNRDEWFRVSISPFGQNATNGRNASNCPVQLGDLGGRWSMIGLLFGPTPEGQTFAPELIEARQVLFPNIPLGTPLGDEQDAAIDPLEQFGFFQVPLEYRKRGVRFEVEFHIAQDFGIILEGGIADLIQTATSFTNLTGCVDRGCPFFGQEEFPNLTIANVDTLLMENLCPIEHQLCRDFDNCKKVSAEDLRLGLWWRHAYLINEDRETWPEFLLIPYALLQGSAAIGNPRRFNHPFDLSFGSNNHNAIGFTAGLNIDFTETIEIGAEAGVTHFFDKSFCNYPVPTSCFQSGIYPFMTSVCVQPGNNWEFGAKMLAYQFLDRLSFYFQYILIRHECDKIRLKCPDPAFKPDLLEDRSNFTNMLGNIAFNYDISPSISIGVLWQAPLAQRNSYRPTTVLFSFNAVY